MSTERLANDTMPRVTSDHRERLLAGLPVTERRLKLAGVSTAVLEGGSGPPVILLHGPGEFGGTWRPIIPRLATTHRVIAPDLPGHGASLPVEGRLDVDGVLAWLGGLIERTCASPPALVGHVLGGAIAARFAVRQGDRVSHLVLVDSLGLAPLRPHPAFALAMVGFMARPTARSYTRFMRQCSFDLEGLQARMGPLWEPYAAYNVQLARGPAAKGARRLMRVAGLPVIPARDLARITVPTTLIWGRQDRANRLRVAEAASVRYGWRLHVIDDCADDPPRDRPDQFLQALYAALGTHDAGVSAAEMEEERHESQV
jgi:pimeloyl-ACP methyl ester carboxylesterase